MLAAGKRCRFLLGRYAAVPSHLPELGSYTPVYLGVAQAAFDELRNVVHARQPEGYAQPLAYHPDVRRHVAEMSADLEAARLITYRSAWPSDTEYPPAEPTAAPYPPNYMVSEALTSI